VSKKILCDFQRSLQDFFPEINLNRNFCVRIVIMGHRAKVSYDSALSGMCPSGQGMHFRLGGKWW